MISGTYFRKNYTVKRRAAGTRNQGRWVEGAESDIVVVASAMPLRGAELQTLPEGKRAMQAIKIYSNTELQTVDEENGVSADVLIYRSERYEVTTSEPWQSDVVTHFKHLAVKELV